MTGDIKKILSEFNEKVDSFTGTSGETDALLALGAKIENDYAGAVDPDYAYDGLGRAIKNLTELFNEAYEDGGTADLLDALKAQDIVVNPAKVAMVPPGEGAINTGSGRGIEIKKEPRLVWLIEALIQDGIGRDQFFVDPGLSVPGAFRQEPYHLINLPGFGEGGRQIGVCNLNGAVSFVSDHIYAPEFYANLSIKKIRDLPGVKAYELHDREKWAKDIITAVKEGVPQANIADVPDLKAAASKKRPDCVHVTPDIIFKALLEQAAKDKVFPSQNFKDEIGGLPGWSGMRLNSHVKKNIDGYSGLPGLRDAYIVEEARKWQGADPENREEQIPPDDATLPGHKDVSFGQVDDWLQQISGIGKSLERVLAEAEPPVFARDYLTPGEVTADLAFDIVLKHALEQDAFISSGSEEEIPGMKNWSGKGLNMHAIRSLGYDGLVALRDAYIAKEARKWQEEDPESRERQIPLDEATLPGHEDVSFGQVDTWLKNIKKAGKTSLEKVLAEAEPPVIARDYLTPGEVTADLVFDIVLKHALEQDAFISSSFKEEIPGMKNWSGQKLNSHVKKNIDGYSGLPGLRDAYIVEEARKWQGADPENREEQIPPDDATLPGHKDVSFGQVDDWLQQISGIGKSLERVLAEAEPPVFARDYLTPGEVTADLAFDIVLKHALEQDAFISSGSEEEIPGMKNWSGKGLNMHAIRSLGYDGLVALRDAYIAKEARKWQEEDPESRERQIPLDEATLPGHEDVSFGQVDTWLKNIKKAGKTSLEKVLAEAEPPVIARDYLTPGEVTADLVFDIVLKHALEQDAFISSSFKEEIPGMKNWSGQKLNSHAIRSLGYDGLVALRDAYIAKEARKWQEEDPESRERQIPPDEATLPGHKDVSFGQVDTWLKNIKASGKSSLEEVLEKAGLVKFSQEEPVISSLSL